MAPPVIHPARRRWLVVAATTAVLAAASGFCSAGLSVGEGQVILRQGTLTASLATRGAPYPPRLDVSDFRISPIWSFERGWWYGGGCTCDTINVDMPLWIPFAAFGLMAGVAPLILARTVRPSRLMVGAT